MFKYEWIWLKTRPNGFLDAKRKPMKKHENILVFYNKLPIYNPQGIILKDKPNKNAGTYNVYGKIKQNFVGSITYTNYPTSILEFKSTVNKYHPTEKPVSLFEYLIKTYTNEGGLVLDNCIGSGTTAISCINTKRNYIGIEQDINYYNTATERVTKHLKNVL